MSEEINENGMNTEEDNTENLNWFDVRLKDEKERNHEVFYNRRSKYVTNETSSYIIERITESVTPSAPSYPIDENGNRRIELHTIRLYENNDDTVLSYYGVMGKYPFGDIFVIDHRCNLEELMTNIMDSDVVKEFEPVITDEVNGGL